MTRGERRKRRKRKIRQRMNLATDINRYPGDANVTADLRESGRFANNNEMNRWGKRGTAKKTKAKHGHASYRHKGAYGKAVDYSPHDLRQVQDMDQQEGGLEDDEIDDWCKPK